MKEKKIPNFIVLSRTFKYIHTYIKKLKICSQSSSSILGVLMFDPTSLKTNEKKKKKTFCMITVFQFVHRWCFCRRTVGLVGYVKIMKKKGIKKLVNN